MLGLIHYVLDSTADLPAPPVRDDAERAELVAAVDDRYVGRHVWSRGEGAHAAFGVDSEPVSQQIDQGLILLGLHEHVHVGEPVGEGVLAGPNHATHQSEHLVRVALHDGLEVGKHTDHAVFGALADDAAIQDYDIGLAGGLAGGQAHLTQSAFETLGVGLVHLTTDCPDEVALHSGLFSQSLRRRLSVPTRPPKASRAWQALVSSTQSALAK